MLFFVRKPTRETST